jgi:hypothetical protein
MEVRAVVVGLGGLRNMLCMSVVVSVSSAIYVVVVSIFVSSAIPSACWHWANVHVGSVRGIHMFPNMCVLRNLCSRHTNLGVCMRRCAKLVCVEVDR